MVTPGLRGSGVFFDAVGVIVPYAAGRYPAVKQYKQINGTSYDARTPDAVVAVLENARLNRQRVHVSLGETEGPQAGRDWMEENMVHGFIRRSTGSVKIPLIVHNRRSLGGSESERQRVAVSCGSTRNTTTASSRFAPRPNPWFLKTVAFCGSMSCGMGRCRRRLRM